MANEHKASPFAPADLAELPPIEGVRLAVDAGALAARVARVDETHLILILEFSTAEDANRVAREVGGSWMREKITPAGRRYRAQPRRSDCLR